MIYEGSLTDIPGVRVGHCTLASARTGCTVALFAGGAVAGVDVRGAAPGTRETDLLRPGNLVQAAHAVLLCGGSAYGLDAAGGVMRYLEEQGVGLDTGDALVPIVPAAVLYDLGVGDAHTRPGAGEGYQACVAASQSPPAQGAVGAGCGATVGKLMGAQASMPGGIGSASMRVGETLIAALVAVNALGDVLDYRTGRILAGCRDQDGRFADTQALLCAGAAPPQGAGRNTTIGIVATDACLTKEQANRLATVAHDGLAWSIRPVHTMMDGDTLFALSCGQRRVDFTALCAAAAEVVARAVSNAVRHAHP